MIENHVVLYEKSTNTVYVLVRGTVFGDNYGSTWRDLSQDAQISRSSRG